jgi:hypothetical protein
MPVTNGMGHVQTWWRWFKCAGWPHGDSLHLAHNSLSGVIADGATEPSVEGRMRSIGSTRETVQCASCRATEATVVPTAATVMMLWEVMIIIVILGSIVCHCISQGLVFSTGWLCDERDRAACMHARAQHW